MGGARRALRCSPALSCALLRSSSLPHLLTSSPLLPPHHLSFSPPLHRTSLMLRRICLFLHRPIASALLPAPRCLTSLPDRAPDHPRVLVPAVDDYGMLGEGFFYSVPVTTTPVCRPSSRACRPSQCCKPAQAVHARCQPPPHPTHRLLTSSPTTPPLLSRRLARGAGRRRRARACAPRRAGW